MKKKVYSDTEIKNDSVSFILLYARPIPRNKSLGAKCLVKYDTKTLLEHQIDEISSVDINKEIILCSGIGFEKIMRQKSNSYRMVNNAFFEETGSIEEIRLSLANSCFNNCIFIGDDYLSKKKDLVELMKSSKIVVSKKNCSDSKLITNGNIAKKINYTSGKHHLMGSFSLIGEELEVAKKYIIGKEYNRNKLYTEMLNYMMDNNSKFTILERQ